MRSRSLASIGAVAFVVATLLAVVPIAGQGPTPAAKATSGSNTWKVAHTAWGHPDLQGVWANNSATPVERPKELEGRQFLTDQELTALQKSAAELFNGDTDAAFGDANFKAAFAKAQGKDANVKTLNGFDTVTGNYNQFWLVDRVYDNRTSLIVDPADGKKPPLTPEGAKRMAAEAEYRKLHPADGPEDLPLGHRCVNFGVPKIGAGYNSYHQIFQTPDHVAIWSEMAHDARIIPLDGRPHAGRNLRQWNGDARGHFEGDTLVIETTNFSPKSEFMTARENLHLTERFTRMGPQTLKYEVTIDDPTTWTRPWSMMIPMSLSHDPIYEYACHEGNEGLPGTLSGYRAKEKASQEASKTPSR